MKLPEVVIFKENKEVRKHAFDQEQKKKNTLSTKKAIKKKW